MTTLGSNLYSVSITMVGKTRAISIDYAKAAARRFPAASEDVAAVNWEFLKSYKPENSGIYGCYIPSLVAGSLAWFMKENCRYRVLLDCSVVVPENLMVTPCISAVRLMALIISLH